MAYDGTKPTATQTLEEATASVRDNFAALEAGANPTATEVSFSPTGNIAATNVQAAIAEVDTEKASTSDLAAKAPLASPTFTGVPAAPTAGAGTNTTQIATTAFATTADNLKANLASPTFTGTPAAPTAGAGTNTTQIATTAFATTADNLKANLASPTFTGTPAAPTAGAGTNTTQLATTQFVQNAVAAAIAAQIIRGTTTWNPAPFSGAGYEVQRTTVTVTGAAVGDAVMVGTDWGLISNYSMWLFGEVTATNQVTINLFAVNMPIDPPSMVIKAVIVK